jgi:hypothetical protein
MREHPLMSYGEIPNWPPPWSLPTEAGKITANGEIGVLKHLMYYGNSTKICISQDMI